MEFPTGSSIKPCNRMFSNSLWLELEFGELGLRGSGGGVSPVVGSSDQREDHSRLVGDGSEAGGGG